ncbi:MULTISPECIES: hypothetical protein [unclassified Streptomyces]|uniref:hypothetical protein n=1 Tax=unclassified Streptomyces TaxID=2593676 RepID=UPI003819D2B4
MADSFSIQCDGIQIAALTQVNWPEEGFNHSTVTFVNNEGHLVTNAFATEAVHGEITVTFLAGDPSKQGDDANIKAMKQWLKDAGATGNDEKAFKNISIITKDEAGKDKAEEKRSFLQARCVKISPPSLSAGPNSGTETYSATVIHNGENKTK